MPKSRQEQGGELGLQVPKQIQLDEAQINISVYICEVVGYNEVGDKGCLHLSKAAWGELRWIQLGYYCLISDRNKTGDRGCRYICEGSWPKIKRVDVGINQCISENCGVREEGSRSMTKHQVHLKQLYCIILIIKVKITKSE